MHNPARGIRLRGSARTNKGQVRENNEDSVHLWASDEEKLLLAIVADGMGGAAAGEEASRTAVDTVFENMDAIAESDFHTLEEETLVEKLRAAVRNANYRIVQRALEEPELKGMGTTLTLVFARNDHALIAHVGDSRAYRIDGGDGVITQITADHSFVQALVDAGHITDDEADEHPMRNVLYRALGQSSDLDVDVYYNTLHVGDRLVLCSDGLTLHVRPAEIAEIVNSGEDPDSASQRLVEMANERGGRDNISVIVISVEKDDTGLGETERMAAADQDPDETLVLDDQETAGIRPGSDNESSPSMVMPVYTEADAEGSDSFNFDQ